MSSATIAIIVAAISAVGGIGGVIVALRKVQPESQKLVLEGQATWTTAQTGYFDKLVAAQHTEAERLRAEMARMRAELDGRAEVESELRQVRRENSELLEQVESALQRAARAEERAGEQLMRLDRCERWVGQLQQELRSHGLSLPPPPPLQLGG